MPIVGQLVSKRVANVCTVKYGSTKCYIRSVAHGRSNRELMNRTTKCDETLIVSLRSNGLGLKV